MKKASELYSLTRRELILLEMFNMLDDEDRFSVCVVFPVICSDAKSCRRTIR